MKRLLVCSLLLIFCPTTASPDDKIETEPWPDLPLIGFITEDESPRYVISSFDFGIEQWEDSKRSERIHQIWYLQCQHPPYSGKMSQTYCSLERQMLVRWDMPGFKTGIHVHKHDTEDGTLRIRMVDWEEGELNFVIVYNDQTTTEVMIRMRYVDKEIFLESFKAIGVARSWFADDMTAIEYRIPEYEYTLELPILIKGYKSEEQKRVDDIVASLDEKDRQIWMSLKNDPELFLIPDKRTLRTILPSYDRILKEKRELTPDEWKTVVQWMMVSLSKRLESAGLSKDAQSKILDMFSEILLKGSFPPIW